MIYAVLFPMMTDTAEMLISTSEHGNLMDDMTSDFFHRKKESTAIVQGFDMDDLNVKLREENNELKKKLAELE